METKYPTLKRIAEHLAQSGREDMARVVLYAERDLGQPTADGPLRVGEARQWRESRRSLMTRFIEADLSRDGRLSGDEDLKLYVSEMDRLVTMVLEMTS